MKKFNFLNQVYVETDKIGSFKDNHIVVGFESYPTNPQHEDNGVYSIDEVKTLFLNNKCTDNISLDENGNLELKISHMSYFKCMTIVNGVAVISPKFKYHNILEYCKEKGYVYDTPQEVNMYAGVKNLELFDDKCKLIYQIIPNKIGLDNFNDVPQRLNHMEKIMIGSIKKLNAQHYITVENGERKRIPICPIDEYYFDKNTLTLTIVLSKEYLSQEKLQQMLSILDLQIYYFYNQNIDYNLHFQALMQCQIDDGCSHIFELKNDSDSNINWYDKQ